MKRIQIASRKARRERSWNEPLPLDPREPDIVRVKARARVASSDVAARNPR